MLSVIGRFLLGTLWIFPGIGMAATACESGPVLTFTGWVVAGVIGVLPRLLFERDVRGALRGALAGLLVLTYVFWVAWLFQHRHGWGYLAVPAAVLAYLAAVEQWWRRVPPRAPLAALGFAVAVAAFAVVPLPRGDRPGRSLGHCSP